MTTHVLIVDEKTFKYHLEYMFIGTGAKDYIVDFNDRNESGMNPSRERLLVSMICDASRIRKNDLIIFYIQQAQTRHDNKGPKEGKFYGVFKAKDNFCFLDNFFSTQYLQAELNKSLLFRTFIEPFEVYEQGVSEWEALDNISNISSPYQMLWSLIYRKLKGNRGNTMITLYESERLIQLIREKNNRKNINGNNFTFNSKNQTIEISRNKKIYLGKKEEINLWPRIITKFLKNQSYEIYLQQLILKEISTNSKLGKIIFKDDEEISWIGNEVGCGVGMQSIDILIESKNKFGRNTLFPIELKGDTDKKSYPYIHNQISRYLDWILQYYKPNRICDISPIIIIPKEDEDSESFKLMLNNIKLVNEKYKSTSFNVIIIFFELDIVNQKINFKKYDY